ncbi:MAG: hypothetical protein ACI4IF_03445 [Acutalibacteraceae bacterium]
MEKEIILKTAYSILRKTTPLSFDCGSLCGRKCCKGDDATGMILFPGEENIIDERITVKERADGTKIAVCNGSCDRNKRPLSCRIYPLFPLVYKDKYGNDTVKAVFDIRGECPLISCDYEFQKSFIKSVRRTGKYLLLNDETKKVYKRISKEVEESYRILEKFI